ncbi:hypothetical protein FJZ33_01740 [Candidatus Poribacteria bacterium]|nr:hypothetical protein [Candidatus Poribacteria bacterium]
MYFFKIDLKIIVFSLYIIAIGLSPMLYAEDLPEEIKDIYSQATENIKSGRNYFNILMQKLPGSLVFQEIKKDIYVDYIPIDTKNSPLRQIIYSFQEELEMAIKGLNGILNSYSEYTDVYIKLIEAYILLGNGPKALELYENSNINRLSKITIPYEELRPIFYELAKAYMDSGMDVIGERVIKKLMTIENERLDKEYEKLKLELEAMEQGHQKIMDIEIQRMLVGLELARFYIYIEKRNMALNEYEIKKEEYNLTFGASNSQYSKAINDLYGIVDSELEAMNCPFELIADQKLLTEQRLINAVLIPQDDNIDNRKFFRLTLIPGDEKVKVLTHFSLGRTRNRASRSIPLGNYNMLIEISGFVKNNRLPFRMDLKRDIYAEDPMISPSLKDKAKMRLEKAGEKPIRIDFSDDVFSNATIMEIDRNYKNISNGLYKTTIEFTFGIKSFQQVLLEIISIEPYINLIEPAEEPITQVKITPKEKADQVKIEVVKPTNQEKPKAKDESKKGTETWRAKLHKTLPSYPIAIFFIISAAIVFIGLISLSD